MTLQNVAQLFAPSFFNDSPFIKTLGGEFVLCDNGSMLFHWADFHETCDIIKAQLEADPSLMRDFELREHALVRLNLIPVWVRTEKKVHQSTMFDLYEKYILNQTHLLGGIDPFCPLAISFISGTGPFKAMSIAECFNKSTYRDFVLVYLLKNKLPPRDYRVRLKSRVLMEYGQSFDKADLISLDQLTMNGMLLSMESEVYMKTMTEQESVRILINSKMLLDGKGLNLHVLKSYLSKFAFNLMYSSNKDDAITCSTKDFSVQSSFDFSKNKRVFLFISYDKMAQTNHYSVQNIRDFVTYTKELVREDYQNEMIKKKTA